MKISLIENGLNIVESLKVLEEDLGVTFSQSGVPLTITKSKNKETTIRYENGKGSIEYGETYHVYRAVGLFVQHLTEKEEGFFIQESPLFDTVGPMFDLSRNVVMRVDEFKRMIRKLALMGFNSAMLYMEDTFEIKAYPYFGYLRGRYTEQELKELDDYAYQFGIELIPCIQTLAHLDEFLKWEEAAHLKDTRGVLLTGEDVTYDFLEKLITAATKPFRSQRIHIGMDEAEDLGRGHYLNQHGYTSRLEIMTEHLEKVTAITKALDLDVMMWSDMFIKLASESGDNQYDLSTEISEDFKENIPKEVDLVYWDYYHVEKEHYQTLIQKHKQLGRTPVVAGGIWVWNTFATKYDFSLKASEALLQASKEEGVKDVFVTLWGDDGFENNFYSAMLGLQLFAEHHYNQVVSQEDWYKRTKFCTGISAEKYLLLAELDLVPGVEEGGIDQTNPSKFLLWQDVLLGVFDKHLEGLDLSTHYEELEEKIKQHRSSDEALDFIWDVPEKVSAVLAKKAMLGVRLKKAYDEKDLSVLKTIANQVIPELIEKVSTLKASHKKQWYTLNKPFGWEVMDIRYGGVVARLETAIERVNDYLTGTLPFIDELEQERLPFNANLDKQTGIGWSTYYYRMASPNVFFHVLQIY
ncbi:beta-N-acetylhexosaminidase [Paraliobacillus salinarum]|uniref:beta-N-acetylhexosaminidase n=1 Tax=Paraliobacillus salinarum TaxID=1158996 RepID=UPI0015F558DC|nr:beta-N-acetylhexosaminidase [Paraliobacillus salinarum]